MNDYQPEPPPLPEWTPDTGPSAQRPRPFWTAGLALRLAILFLGPLLLVFSSLAEFHHVSRTPLGHAILVFDIEEPLWNDMIPVRSRRLPPGNFPDSPTMESLREEEMGQDLIDQLGLEQHERVIALPEDAIDWGEVLVSGRVPQPGEPEVLAGPLARLDRFFVNDESFEVVGRMPRSVSGFGFAYALPKHEAFDIHFDSERGGQTGWFASDGMPQLIDHVAHEEIQDLEFAGGSALIPFGLALLNLVGVFVAAAGGVLVWTYLFRHLSERLRPAWLAEPFQLIERHPAIFWGLHGVLYGALFLSMLAALFTPVWSLRLSDYTQQQFAEGGLQFVGDAYLSGQILYAAAATWFWNYVVATVQYSFLPSLVIPWAGVVKNLLSFTLVGYVMMPMWTGMAGMMSFHVGTLVLELEPYVLASFYIALYPIYMWRGITAGLRENDWRDVFRAFRIMGIGAFFVGIMLAVAALYEAVTLILLSP